MSHASPLNAAPAMPGEDSTALLHLGNRIRALRTSRGLTLADLSQKSQVSVAMLSHIERSQASPSIRTLDRIRRALDVPLMSFFVGSTENDRPNSGVVVRRSERPTLQLRHLGLEKEMLSPAGETSLEMLMLVMAPGGGSGEEPWTGSGEKGGVVLTGSFELHVGARRYTLMQEDSFQFDSTQPHWFKNLSSSETRVLWIIRSSGGLAASNVHAEDQLPPMF